jgi:hypothetical protein
LGCKDEKHLSAPLPSLMSSYKDEKHLSKPLPSLISSYKDEKHLFRVVGVKLVLVLPLEG